MRIGRPVALVVGLLAVLGLGWRPGSPARGTELPPTGGTVHLLLLDSLSVSMLGTNHAPAIHAAIARSASAAVVSRADPLRSRERAISRLGLTDLLRQGAVRVDGPGAPGSGPRPRSARESMEINDSAVAEALADQRTGEVLVVLSLQPPPGVYDHTFVSVIDIDHEPATLWSPSTHRDGLVTIDDVRSMIRHLAGAPPSSAGAHTPGAVPRIEHGAGDPASWASTTERARAQRAARRKSFDALSILSSAAAVTFLAASVTRGRPPISTWLRTLGRFVLLTSCAWPAASLAWLLTGGALGPPQDVGRWVTATVGVSALAAVALLLILRRSANAPMTRHACRIGPLTVIAAVTAAVITLDLALGSGAATRHPLGPSLLLGARFYGLSNDLFAVFIAAVAIVVSAGSTVGPEHSEATGGAPFRARLPTQLWVITLAGAVTAGPWLGADFGGTLVFALLAVVIVFGDGARRRAPTALLLLATLALTTALLAGEMLDDDMNRSHIGRFLASVRSEGPAMLKHKLDILGRSFAHDLWLMLALPSLAAAVAAIAGAARWRTWPEPSKRGLALLVVAAIAGTLLNDSGPVVAAIISGWAASLLLEHDLSGRTAPEPSR